MLVLPVPAPRFLVLIVFGSLFGASLEVPEEAGGQGQRQGQEVRVTDLRLSLPYLCFGGGRKR